MDIQHGIFASVTGEIVPYAFASDTGGEDIGGVNLRIPGDVVKVQIPPELARKMSMGEVWTITGRAMVSKGSSGGEDGRKKSKPAALRIYEVHSMKRLVKARDADQPVQIDWGASEPAQKQEETKQPDFKPTPSAKGAS